MGFSMRIFPGVRIGVTRRGMNASVGPRIARVHAGPGGLRYSSGLGPFSVSGGGSRRRGRSRSSGGLDFAAFDEAMRVSPEQRTARLEREIQRLEKKGWKLTKRDEFSALMARKSTEKRKVTWLIVFGVLTAMFLQEVANNLLGLTPPNPERPLPSMIIAAVIFGGALAYQIVTFAAKKSANRKFEVGEYGVLHKHYHG